MSDFETVVGGTRARAAVKPMELIGRTLGEFHLKKKLGHGGFGTVYLADQKLLGREAVVKVLLPKDESSTEFELRFLREARLASAIDHPFAAHIYSFGAEPDGVLWIAMELVRGIPLDEWLRSRGPIPPHQFIPLMEKLCEVVHQLHLQGITHRDLKPANVMVISRSGRLMPKLLDLGIAKRRVGALRSDSLEAKEHGVSAAREAAARADATSRGGDGAEAHLSRAWTRNALAEASPPSEAPAGLTRYPTPTPRWSGELTEQLERSIEADLTPAGLTIGSPAYMSPEQWTAPEDADERTDIYALGALAYHALTGRTLYDKRRPADLEQAHRFEPPPSLGPAFPAELDAIVQKALAKHADDRFPDALALAAAFRACAGIAGLSASLPELEPSLREVFIQEAPRPLAEAVGDVESANRARPMLASILKFRQLSVQWLAMLALASRARVGKALSNTEPLEPLTRYRDGIAGDGAFWRMARALCEGYERYPSAHPLPELVELCWGPGGEAGRKALETLLEVELPAEEGGADRLSERLARAVAALGQWLDALRFTTAYGLVFTRPGAPERWSGIRRPRSQPAPELPGVPEGQLVLLHPDGEVALGLWPLIQAISPTPGVPEECFLLDGRGRYGAKLVSRPMGFERHDEQLWSWFSEHVAPLEDERSGPNALEEAPYLGLSSFSSAQAANFFGREREAEAFANRIRVQPLLAVVGPSGAGKSSFIQAGVVPLLPPEWRTVTIRPGGATPLQALRERLASLEVPVPATAELAARPHALADALEAWTRGTQRPLLLVVDQFEELVTLCPDREEQLRYASALAMAARAPDTGVRIVLTLRDDFLIRVQALPPLRERIGQGLQLLSTPVRDELQRIVLEPARRVGYVFDDPSLPEEMVRTVEHQTGALALLSFTASQLWELRDRQRRQLTRKSYVALGGVGGALAHHAEATLSALTPEAQGHVREIFRHLVTAEGTRAILSQQQLSEILGGGPAAAQALESLIQARLLVASEGADGDDRIEVVHEALLASWPRLVRWQKDDAENVRVRDQLRDAARLWDERGRTPDRLWRGEALLEYRLWRGRYQGGLTRLEAAFAEASLREERRGRRLRQGMVAGAGVALLVVIALLTSAYRSAHRATLEAHRRLAENHLEQGRSAILAGDVARGLVYVGQAATEGLDGPGLKHLAGYGAHVLAGTTALLEGHKDAIAAVLTSPDGKLAATASTDGTLRLWRLEDGVLLHTVELHSPASFLALSPDGRTYGVGTYSGKVLFGDWSGAVQGELAFPPAPEPAGITTGLDFSPDGKLLAATAQSGRLAVWELASRRRRFEATASTAQSQVVFSPDSRHVFSVPGPFQSELAPPKDANINLWDARTGALEVLRGHKAFPRFLALHAKAGLVATGDDHGAVRLWDLATLRPVGAFEAHAAGVQELAFSPDGASLVTAGADGVARLWDLKSLTATFTLRGHRGPVRKVRFDASGRRVYTGGEDGVVRQWDPRSGELRWTFAGHSHLLTDLALTPDGSRLITSTLEPTLRVWRTDLWLELGRLPLPGRAFVAALRRDGREALVFAVGSLTHVDLETGRILKTYPLDSAVQGIAWSPDGRQVATLDPDGVGLWSFPEMQRTGKLPLAHQRWAAAEYSADGQRLLSAVAEQQVQLWDVLGRRLLQTFHPEGTVTDASFAPDGRRLAVGDDAGGVTLYDSARGDAARHWVAHAGGGITSVRWSPDGRRLLTASDDRTAAIWSVTTGACEAVLADHAQAVSSAVFSPDGELALTVSLNGEGRVWETGRGSLVQSFQAGSGALVGLFDNKGQRMLTAGALRNTLDVWPVWTSNLSAEQLRAFLRCNVPYVFQGREVVPASVDRRACPQPTLPSP